MNFYQRKWLEAACISMLILAPGSAAVGQEDKTGPDLSSLSLEQLTHLEVNAVSRRDQQLFETPAAVYVITHDDIMRSGATSVPEVLRMVPGMEVAEIDANTWAVSARGFNARFANKMLVMIDDRSIYCPVYSGTLWDQNDLLLADIERIEVVRGPGGTMWGANAVNGVINIVTRTPRDTRGTLVTTVGGRIDQVGAARYGAALGNAADYRVFSKYVHRDSLDTWEGKDALDSGSSQRLGARMDWRRGNRDTLRLEGDLYSNGEGHRINFGYDPATWFLDHVHGGGGYLLERWERKLAHADTALQAYYSDERRTEMGLHLNMQTVDLDFQHHLIAGSRNEIVWGSGFRWTSDFTNGPKSFFAHSDHVVHLYSTFFQDSLTLIPGTLVATGGTKVQWNSYTRFEVQPSIRLLWTPDTRETLWASVSRAVRTPSDQDRDVHLEYPLGEYEGLPLYGMVQGNPNVASEVVMAYEAGYRRRLGDRLSVDLAGFVNHYSDLEATAVSGPNLVAGPHPYLLWSQSYFNGFSATTAGTEAALAFTPSRAVRFQASYAWMQARLVAHGASTVLPFGGQDWQAPRHTLDARLFYMPTTQWTLSAVLNGNSSIPSLLPMSGSLVPQHLRIDLRAARHLGERGEMSAGVTNLMHKRHEEFWPEDYTMQSQVPRSAYVKLQWSF